MLPATCAQHKAGHKYQTFSEIFEYFTLNIKSPIIIQRAFS